MENIPKINFEVIKKEMLEKHKELFSLQLNEPELMERIDTACRIIAKEQHYQNMLKEVEKLNNKLKELDEEKALLEEKFTEFDQVDTKNAIDKIKDVEKDLIENDIYKDESLLNFIIESEHDIKEISIEKELLNDMTIDLEKLIDTNEHNIQIEDAKFEIFNQKIELYSQQEDSAIAQIADIEREINTILDKRQEINNLIDQEKERIQMVSNYEVSVIPNLNEKMKDLKLKISVIDLTVGDKIKNNDNLKMSCDELNEKLKTEQMKGEDLLKALEDIKSKREELMTTGILSDEISGDCINSEKIRNEMNDIKKLNEDKNEILKDIKSIENDNEELTNKLKNLTSNYDSEVVRLQSELTKLKEANDENHNRLQLLINDNSEAQKRIMEQKLEKERLDTEIGELTIQDEKLKEVLQYVKEKLEEYKNAKKQKISNEDVDGNKTNIQKWLQKLPTEFSDNVSPITTEVNDLNKTREYSKENQVNSQTVDSGDLRDTYSNPSIFHHEVHAEIPDPDCLADNDMDESFIETNEGSNEYWLDDSFLSLETPKI